MKNKNTSRLMAMLLSVTMIFSSLPVTAFAQDSGGCTHTHVDTCGHGEAAPCGHEHDAACGYAQGSEGTPCSFAHEHDDACGYNGENADTCNYDPGSHTHDDACGYGEPVVMTSCGHGHSEDCGYAEAAPCGHVCDESCSEPGLVESSEPTEPVSAYTITGFATLDAGVWLQEVTAGAKQADLNLPGEIIATIGGNEQSICGVTWECPTYNEDTGMTQPEYEWKAMLPQGYTIEDGVALPGIFALVESSEPMEPVSTYTITGFATLNAGVWFQEVTAGAKQADLNLPGEIIATIGGNEQSICGVTWECPAYNEDTGMIQPEYEWKAMLPQGYTIEEGVALPGIFALVDGGGIAMPMAMDITGDFTDSKFLAAVRVALKKGDSDPIYDTDVDTITILDVFSKNIASLEGIEHFTALTTLDCHDNELTFLPATLPSSLTVLYCQNNELTSLPATLPSNLTVFYCGNNELTSLPATLPSRLTRLECSNNQLTFLPGVLPSSLTSLSCNDNRLTSLPATLPSGLTSLMCGGNQLTSLPPLPSGLKSLSYSYNQLTSLPELPSGLTTLYCEGNELTSLPALPSGLTTLYCSYNRLTSLPPLPSSLTGLECSNNQLTSLPAVLPSSLTFLSCRNNNLTALALNSDAAYFYIDISNNYIADTSAVTGQPIVWDSDYFTFTPQKKRVDITSDFTDSNFLAAVRVVLKKGDTDPIYDLDVDTITILDVFSKNIASLEGIEHFTTLAMLDCHDNQLTSLPATLPSSLTSLFCDNNQLTSLPGLPRGLTALVCSYNGLISLPETLPSGLTSLFCDNNQLTSLPELPSSLTMLDCRNNNLRTLALNSSAAYAHIDISNNHMINTSVVTGQPIPWDTGYFTFTPQKAGIDITSDFTDPNFLAAVRVVFDKGEDEPIYNDDDFASVTDLIVPYKNITSLAGIENFTALTKLLCSGNELASLPATLPSSLIRLECDYNELASLPALPSSLTELSCNDNDLMLLPVLPNGLTELSCGENQLRSLPELPSSLARLSCPDNQLTSLPPLPNSLIMLSCGGNQLTSLPGLSSSLITLYCYDNQLTSLPETLPSGLTSLFCDNNQLTSLPELPGSLTELSCRNNDLPMLALNSDGVYSRIDVRNNYMASTSAVTGKTIPWETGNFSFKPQRTSADITEEITDPNFIAAVRAVFGKGASDPVYAKEVSAIITLDVSGKDIASLAGLEHFTLLATLNCSENNLTSLPPLPSSLTTLNCSKNNLTSLPPLPSSLTTLNCSKNNLTSLPLLPSSLTRLNCSNNKLSLLALNSSAAYAYIDVSNNFMENTSAVTGQLIQWDTPGFTFTPQGTGIDITNDFTDPHFLAVVRAMLGKTPTDSIYNDDFASVTELDVFQQNIESLAGIENFTALTTLICGGNTLTFLPALPSSLTKLICQGNQLTSLPALPSGLTILSCGNNKLTSLPPLPSGLIELNCFHNQLTSLPPLPSSLIELNCFNNQLTSLPGLPSSLTRLDCDYNKLRALALNSSAAYDYIHVKNNFMANTSAVTGQTIQWDTPSFTFTPQKTGVDITEDFTDPNFRAAVRTALGKDGTEPIYNDDDFASVTELNVSYKSIASLGGIENFTLLETLDCSYNQLTLLPETLPSSLATLSCGGNQLTSLPGLPSSLTELSCGGNQLTSLPGLPNSLTELLCGGNQLTSLPGLPSSLTELSCGGNQLTSLPRLPSSLTELSCGDNQLTSLPGLPSSLTELSCENNKLRALALNSTATYSHIDVSNNFMTSTSAVTGHPVVWDTPGFTFTPQRTGVDITADFIDPNFLAAVRVVLKKGDTDPIYSDDNFALVTDLSISSKNIASLGGIENFTLLETLDCSDNQLTSLPVLPGSLISLNCNNNKLRALALNSGATYAYIDVSNNFMKNTSAVTGQPIEWDDSNFIFIPQRSDIDITEDITDFNFLAAVRTALGKGGTDPIYDTDVDTITFLDVSGKRIASLGGIEHFTALATLNCSNNWLSSLPTTLPRDLTTLNCSNNGLRSLPATLPSGLTTFNCSNNQLRSLPAMLPSGLTTLNCSNSQLTSLPMLPSSLKTLDCHSNGLTSLPVTLPSSLKTLDCSINGLTSLPALPSGLKWLDCFNNELTSLPTLPRGLTTLYCYNNGLTSLPALPEGLTELFCNNNNLTALPALPRSLTELFCYDNNLRFLALNSEAAYLYIDASNNYMADTSAITGQLLPWDSFYFTFTPQKTGGVPPNIAGPTTMMLTVGYAATSTSEFSIGGAMPVTVTKQSGDAKITWNAATQKLDIAAGLTAGSYPVVLKAANGVTPDATITFTLTVTDGSTTHAVIVTGLGGATAITQDGGSLQLLASVLPAGVSQEVIWSIAIGGNLATINNSGLLTATGNGRVTVKARANDGSGVEGLLEITISGQTTPAVMVSSIKVTGAGGATAITTNGGRLQMAAAVLPVDATNQTVIWSVEKGTGSATINNSGRLTATGNGRVTVKARANDGSGVEGSLEITISGQTAPTYTASLTVNKDGVVWPAHGKTFTLKLISDETVTHALAGAGLSQTATVQSGVWKVYEGTVYTGQNITISGVNGSTALNYYTVNYSVSNGGDATDSMISAIYGGVAVAKGGIVLGGKALMVTATGQGATTYTYAWGGTASGTASTYTTTVNAAVNATCVITGTNTGVTVRDIAVKTQPSRLRYTVGNGLDLTGLSVMLTFSDASTQRVEYADFGTWGISIQCNGGPITHGVALTTAHNGKPLVLGLNALTAQTNTLIVDNTSVKYAIATTAGTGGSITPGGRVMVAEGGNQTFTVTANSGYKIKDVLVDGSSVGAVPSYTFNNVAAGHTIQAQFATTTGGDSEDGQYTHTTLTDNASGVKVSGNFASGAALAVTKNALHEAGTCTACETIRRYANPIALYDISLQGGYNGNIKVSIPVPSAYNGQTVAVGHCRGSHMEEVVLTVQNGYITGTFSSLSPFAVFAAGNTDVPVPQAGDNSSSWLWLGLMVSTSLMAVFAAWRHRKRRRVEARQ